MLMKQVCVYVCVRVCLFYAAYATPKGTDPIRNRAIPEPISLFLHVTESEVDPFLSLRRDIRRTVQAKRDRISRSGRSFIHFRRLALSSHPSILFGTTRGLP